MTSEPEKGPLARDGEERRPFITREERDRRRRAAIESLAVGEWREGRVTSTTAFGAFVNLGDVDGLIHISQLGEGGYVARVEDVVTVGQTVRVRVVEIDPERGRVSLSMREPGAARPPRPSRPEGAALRPSVGMPAPLAPVPGPDEARETDRRPAGARRQHAERAPQRGAPRRDEERQRGVRRNVEDEGDWRDLRGGSARDYAYFDGADDEEEPAPQSAEELVARFSRRDDEK